MSDATQYNSDMKLSGVTYKTVWKTDKRTGYQYKVVITIKTK